MSKRDRSRCVWCMRFGCANIQCTISYHNAMWIWAKGVSPTMGAPFTSKTKGDDK